MATRIAVRADMSPTAMRIIAMRTKRKNLFISLENPHLPKAGRYGAPTGVPMDSNLLRLDFGQKAFNTVGVNVSSDKAELYRKLPSVDELLRRRELRVLIDREGQTAATEAARTVLASLREA